MTLVKPWGIHARRCGDRLVVNIDTDIGYHPILYPILTPISVVAVADIGHLDIGPDINTNIRVGYVVYDIGDRMPRYR
jgi:hypothetical protein